jgi:hypothetical protein
VVALPAVEPPLVLPLLAEEPPLVPVLAPLGLTEVEEPPVLAPTEVES